MSEAPRIPSIVRERLRAGELRNTSAPPASVSHPDAGMLTALTEGTLAPKSRNEVLAHLAACEDCRTVLVLRQPEEASAQPVGARFQLKTVRWRAIAWAVLAASVALAIGLTSIQKLGSPGAQPSLEARNEITKNATVNSKSAPEKTALPANTANAAVPPQLQGRLQSRDKEADQKVEKFRSVEQVATVSKIAGAAAALKEAPAEQASLSRYDEAEKKQLPARAALALSAPAAVPSVPVAQQEAQGMAKDALSANEWSHAAGSFSGPKQDSGMGYLGQARTAPQAQAAVEPSPVQDKAQATNSNVEVAKSKAPVMQGFARVAPVISTANDLDVTAAAQNQPQQWRVQLGKVQRAPLHSESWMNVVVSAGTMFHAVVAISNQVWAGGNDHGQQYALFHSVDGGGHWQGPILVQENGVPAKGNIDAITFDNPVQGKIRMSSGELWVTTDAGKTWTKQ